MKTVKGYIESGCFEDCGYVNRRLKGPMTDLLLAIDEPTRMLFCEDPLAFCEKLMASTPESVVGEAENTLDSMGFPFSVTIKGEECPFAITREDVIVAIRKIREFINDNLVSN
jgi:hypothetical protein